MADGDAILFTFALIDDTVLLFLFVYYVITLSDLECDYINATQCCDKLNKFVLPEIIFFCLLPLTLLFWNVHWVLFLVNLPYALWIVNRYLNKPSGDLGIFDPLEIHNRNTLKGHMKENMVKLGYHLVFFFIYLYSMIAALIS